MWNEMDWSMGQAPELEITSISPLQEYSDFQEESYSMFFSTFNPNSSLYSSNNETHLGVSVGTLKFCILGLGVTIISVLGLIGNVLTIIVLSSPRMRSPSMCFLLCLSVCDTVVLISAIPLVGILSMLSYSPKGFNLGVVEYLNLMPIAELYAVNITACFSSVYFTMAITMERYIAVCRPIYAKFLQTWTRTSFISAVIFAITILYNLPRWWEYEYVTETICENYTVTRPVPSAFRRNPIYDTYYYHVGYFINVFILPISFLIVFNLLICRGIKQANSLRKSMSPLKKNEISLTKMLFGVVTVFLACQIAAAFRAIYRYGMDRKEFVAEVDFLWPFMLILNSSVNFLIYCVTGVRFRDVLCSLFCCWRGRKSHDFRQVSYRRTTFHRTMSHSRHRVSLQQQELI